MPGLVVSSHVMYVDQIGSILAMRSVNRFSFEHG